jgi:NAD(P)H-quinone oxidoreductase subunit 2
MRPLQVGLILSLVATSLAGILSNPLFTLANDSVSRTPMLQAAIISTQKVAAVNPQPSFSTVQEKQ